MLRGAEVARLNHDRVRFPERWKNFHAPPMIASDVAGVRIAAGGGAVRFTEFVKRDWSEGRMYRRDRIVELFRKLIHSGRLVKTYEEKR